MTRLGLSLAVGLLALVGPPSGVPALNGDPTATFLELMSMALAAPKRVQLDNMSSNSSHPE